MEFFIGFVSRRGAILRPGRTQHARPLAYRHRSPSYKHHTERPTDCAQRLVPVANDQAQERSPHPQGKRKTRIASTFFCYQHLARAGIIAPVAEDCRKFAIGLGMKAALKVEPW